ncbi:hypothetical protein EVAR_37065_1 [Eumeta japonica]|uniref:Uncharacterized protein n=1 Tax=Eumeta variegata TaxID=151549 RepID=A0A4C1WGL6_EUMVA|nr:hypothetical protein EVAR_37065_1 [Eumeta japonica]
MIARNRCTDLVQCRGTRPARVSHTVKDRGCARADFSVTRRLRLPRMESACDCSGLISHLTITEEDPSGCLFPLRSVTRTAVSLAPVNSGYVSCQSSVGGRTSGGKVALVFATIPLLSLCVTGP